MKAGAYVGVMVLYIILCGVAGHFLKASGLPDTAPVVQALGLIGTTVALIGVFVLALRGVDTLFDRRDAKKAISAERDVQSTLSEVDPYCYTCDGPCIFPIISAADYLNTDEDEPVPGAKA